MGDEMSGKSLRVGLMLAAGMLMLSLAMYVVFFGRHIAGSRDWLTRVAALSHFPLAGLCGVLCLYLFVRHGSLRAMGLMLGSGALMIFYLSFIL